MTIDQRVSSSLPSTWGPPRHQKYKDMKSQFDVIALAAASQTKGRGTSGRAWVGLGGNVFLTLAIPNIALPFPITLLPLRIGILVAKGKHNIA